MCHCIFSLTCVISSVLPLSLSLDLCSWHTYWLVWPQIFRVTELFCFPLSSQRDVVVESCCSFNSPWCSKSWINTSQTAHQCFHQSLSLHLPLQTSCFSHYYVTEVNSCQYYINLFRIRANCEYVCNMNVNSFFLILCIAWTTTTVSLNWLSDSIPKYWWTNLDKTHNSQMYFICKWMKTKERLSHTDSVVIFFYMWSHGVGWFLRNWGLVFHCDVWTF